MDKRPVGFEELLDFPSLFVFRVIADSGAAIQVAIIAAAEASLGRSIEGVESKPSAKGRYTVHRVGAMVISAAEIRATYTALHEVDGVRMVL